MARSHAVKGRWGSTTTKELGLSKSGADKALIFRATNGKDIATIEGLKAAVDAQTQKEKANAPSRSTEKMNKREKKALEQFPFLKQGMSRDYSKILSDLDKINLPKSATVKQKELNNIKSAISSGMSKLDSLTVGTKENFDKIYQIERNISSAVAKARTGKLFSMKSSTKEPESLKKDVLTSGTSPMALAWWDLLPVDE